ncbi:hypothetical protein GW17_00025779, partial [Ensete ventricosum]
TTTSSGCKRNRSTLHTKVRNKPSYKQLEKLVYVHYNIRLRLRCVELDKETEESYINLIDLQFSNKDSEPMLEWVETAKNQRDPLLDTVGDPQHPSRFITETIEEKAHPQHVKNPPQSERDGRSQQTSDTQQSQSSV